MIVGSWTYSISNSNAIKAFNTAATYFKKYGAIGASIGNHLGRDNGLYSVNIGYEIMLILVKLMIKFLMMKIGQKIWSPIFQIQSGKQIIFMNP